MAQAVAAVVGTEGHYLILGAAPVSAVMLVRA
jgi:hypothetical protein